MPSKRLQQPAQFLIGQLPSLRLLFQILRLGDDGIPFIGADFPSLLSHFQLFIGFRIFLLRRRGGGALPRLLAVCTHLAAGALGLTRCQIVAITSIIAGCQKKVFAAVMAATRRVTRHQPPTKVRVEEVCEIRNRIVVPKEKFIAWVEENTGGAT